MKKSLCWLYPHLEHDDGGTKFLFEVTRRLTKIYKITIVCNTGQEWIIEKFKRHGIEVNTISSISADSNLYWLFLPFFLLSDIRSYKRYAASSDIIFASLFPTNVIAWLLSSFYKKPYFFYCYEPFPYLHNGSFIASLPSLKRLPLQLFSLCYSWLDWIAVRSAKKIFTLNEITKKMTYIVYKKHAIKTLMGVDTDHFRPVTDNSLRDRFKKRIVILHATDYSQYKRTDLAIITISHLAKSFPSILLVVTSTHPHAPRKKLYVDLVTKLGVTENVYFADYVPYLELPAYFTMAVCYLSCSMDAMFGTTSSNLPVKEAMSCGTPALRSNITTEDVIDGVSGFLITPGRTKITAQKIAYLITHPKKRKEMGERARKTIMEKYSWDRVTQLLVSEIIS